LPKFDLPAITLIGIRLD